MMTSRLVDLNPQMCITADKGFNYSAQDEAFIVQKKNHFQVYVYFILLSLTYRQLLFKKNPKYSFIFQVTCDVQFNGTPRFISKAAVSNYFFIIIILNFVIIKNNYRMAHCMI